MLAVSHIDHDDCDCEAQWRDEFVEGVEMDRTYYDACLNMESWDWPRNTPSKAENCMKLRVVVEHAILHGGIAEWDSHLRYEKGVVVGFNPF